MDEEHQPKAGNLMDSRTSHLDDVLSERLEEAFHKTTFDVQLHDVALIAAEYNPIDLAYAASRLPPSARPVLFENLPNLDAKTQFIITTDSASRWAIFRTVNDDEITKIVRNMPADEAVWV
nr:magnesium transporter [Chlamydiota bacterium]